MAKNLTTATARSTKTAAAPTQVANADSASK